MHSEVKLFAARFGRKVLIAACVTAILVACNSTPPDRIAYNTISDATASVQAAVSTYKRHCGVAPGAPGPGTCPAAEYQKGQQAYADFQRIATDATDIASRTGQTPLQVVSAAATATLNIYANLK